MALPSKFDKGTDQLPRTLRGFGHINRFVDRRDGKFIAKILPGEYYVTNQDEYVATVLGSCVSACIRDKETGLGGMNHFMLPKVGSDEKKGLDGKINDAARYGNFAMEHMINDILKNGGKRENLEVKLTGGGRIIANMTNVGLKNIEFVREYIRTEGLLLVAEELGEIYPRKVLYHPLSGKMKVKRLRALHNNTVLDRETRYMNELEVKPISGDVELF